MRRRRLAASILLCGALGFAGGSLAQSGGRAPTGADVTTGQPPTELWSEFPLGNSTVNRASTAASEAPPLPVAAEPGGSDASDQLAIVGVVALAMLAVASGALAFLRSRQRRLVAESREGLLAIVAEQRSHEQQRAAIQAFTTALGCDRVSHRPRARGKQVREESEVKSPEQTSSAGARGYAELGDRVAAVLQAAEEAAAQIRADAQTQADQVTRQADQESKQLLEDARNEAQRVRVEADREAKNTREAVESYASNHRREAEEKAAKTLAEAEGQARASREAAEAMAQRIEESARTLEEEVREQERMIRGRMQRYLAALRDVSAQIEEVLGEADRGEPALVEALDPEQRAKQEASS